MGRQVQILDFAFVGLLCCTALPALTARLPDSGSFKRLEITDAGASFCWKSDPRTAFSIPNPQKVSFINQNLETTTELLFWNDAGGGLVTFTDAGALCGCPAKETK